MYNGGIARALVTSSNTQRQTTIILVQYALCLFALLQIAMQYV